MSVDEAWRTFHKGESATKSELRQALLVALQLGEVARCRLRDVEPVFGPIEELITKMIDDRLDGLSIGG